MVAFSSLEIFFKEKKQNQYVVCFAKANPKKERTRLEYCLELLLQPFRSVPCPTISFSVVKK